MNEDSMLDLELHAFIDGELDADRTAVIAARIAEDPALAERVAAYRSDQARLVTLFGPLIDQSPPHALVRAVEAAAHARRSAGRHRWRRRAAWGAALAASLLCVWQIAMRYPAADSDRIVAAALAARNGGQAPARHYDAGSLGADPDRLLRDALAAPIKLPDLGKAGYILTGVDLYPDARDRSAVQLRYRDGEGRLFTVYLRHGDGADRFDLMTRGATRICIWENEDLGAVMVGDMSSEQMLRVASLTYADLNF